MFITMYSIDEYTNLPGQWSDPDANFGTVNDSFLRNNIRQTDYVTNDNVYKSNETKNNIGVYSMASYMLIPLYGTMQQNPATSPPRNWQQKQQHQQPKQNRPNSGFLSSDAIPFIPTKFETSKNRFYLFFHNKPLTKNLSDSLTSYD